MMQPEHTRRVINNNHDELRKERPVLDPKEWEFIDQALYYSMEEHSPVTLTLFDPFTDRVAKGIVIQVDRLMKRIKLRWSEEDWDWVDMSEIIAAAT
ncbi:YolD-like family protein [Paenibacillus rhizophilus]|uniref:YolD-like family protein n=1 Tax=Paenibacillus rhizophilus TaxID=1850366 RepID=A0A3N9PAL9_9BACL|nr:YolD-like family protein [Paenibacillus rhizophilus]RQW13271.1 YolD-like family protein [Paenibacillus rhizophilus]